MGRRGAGVVAVTTRKRLTVAEIPYAMQSLTVDGTGIGDVRRVGPRLAPKNSLTCFDGNRRRKIEHRDRSCDAGFQAIVVTDGHRHIEDAAIGELIGVIRRLKE